MSSTIGVIILTALVVILFLISVAKREQFISRISGPAFVLIAVSGFYIYGYGYSLSEQYIPIAVVKASLQVCSMFAGSDNFSVVEGTPVFSTMSGQLFFWAVHMFAIYLTAGAIVHTLGASLVRRCRTYLMRFSKDPLYLIYSANDKSVQYASYLRKKYPKGDIVLLDQDAEYYAEDADKYGLCPIDPEEEGYGARLGLKRRNHIHLFCLHEDGGKNTGFAEKFEKILKEYGTKASLTLRGTEETAGYMFSGKDAAYSHVFVFQEESLTARMLVQNYPLYDTVEFNADGLPQSDIHVLLVGFGKLGEAVLKELVQNGQFEGNTTHFYVVDETLGKHVGQFTHTYAEMLKQYDIQMCECNARSSKMYEFLGEKTGLLNMAVLCTGDEYTNDVIAEELNAAVKDSCEIIKCLNGTMIRADRGAEEDKSITLYESGVLDTDEVDRMAVTVNHVYSGNGDAQQQWAECSYFNRLSSRATADFIPAYLKMAGCTAEEAAKNWDPQGELLENLSKTEHLRWSAFHYANGYHAMTDEMLAERAAVYKKQTEEKTEPRIRLTVDRENRYHACLISWDELDRLSAQEEAITGKAVNYKEYDRQNIREIDQMLKSS